MYNQLVIEIHDLQKMRGDSLALEIPALDIQTGQIAAVYGLAGSGKGLLLDLLLGRQQPSTGTIRLAGLDPASQKAKISRLLGVLFAEDSLYKQLSPLENLAFHAQLHGLPRSRAAWILAQVGLADQAQARIENLSPALQRRLAFGRLILHQPKVLIMVEPFARCDEDTCQLLERLLRKQVADGCAALILNQSAEGLSSLCDAIYPLYQGRLGDALRPSQDASTDYPPFKIAVRLEDKVILLNPADILYAEASAERALIATANERLPSQFTLSELEQRLSRSGFFRAHRSYLVNLQHIKAVIPYTRSSFTLRLDDANQTEIPLSKSAAAELKDLLGY